MRLSPEINISKQTIIQNKTRRYESIYRIKASLRTHSLTESTRRYRYRCGYRYRYRLIDHENESEQPARQAHS